jgi:hypothetical protein
MFIGVNMDLQDLICKEIISSPEWENSLSYCVPGIYGIYYWEVFIENNDIHINGDEFVFINAYFYFRTKMYGSNDYLIEDFTKKASGKGKFIFSDGKYKIYDIEINYDYDLLSIPFLGKHSLTELRKLYRNRMEVKETGKEEFRIYVESINQKYESLKAKNYLNENITKLKVSNYGNIEYNGKLLKPTIVKERKIRKDYWENWMEQWKDIWKLIFQKYLFHIHYFLFIDWLQRFGVKIQIKTFIPRFIILVIIIIQKIFCLLQMNSMK